MGRSNVSSSIFAGLSSPNNRTPRNCPDATATCRTDWIAPPPAATPSPPIIPPLLPPSPTPPPSLEWRLRFCTPAPCAPRISCLRLQRFGPRWSPTNETATKLVDVEQTNKINNKCCRRRGRASTRHCEQHRQHKPATNSEARTHMHILAEGAIALSVTLSGGALFAS